MVRCYRTIGNSTLQGIIMSIQEILMKRDGLSQEEADDLVKDAQEDLWDCLETGKNTDYLCQEWFGLEPDYLLELI